MEQVSQLDEEWLDIVDDKNQVVAQASRAQMRSQNLRHRATFIVVHDGMGKILAHRRAQGKDIYPGKWAVTVGGVVKSGEGLLESARREAEEELGIADVPFADHGTFYFENECSRFWGGLFSCVSQGPFALQEEEVSEICWVQPEEVAARCEEFTPDTLKAFLLWMNRNSESENYQIPCQLPQSKSAAQPKTSLSEQAPAE